MTGLNRRLFLRESFQKDASAETEKVYLVTHLQQAAAITPGSTLPCCRFAAIPVPHVPIHPPYGPKARLFAFFPPILNTQLSANEIFR